MFSICRKGSIKSWTNIKLFINKCSWEEIKYTTKTDDWKRFGQNLAGGK